MRLTGVNHLATHGRWAFAEFCDFYAIKADFAEKVKSQFEEMLLGAIASSK